MAEYRYYVKKIYQPSPDLVVIEAGERRGQPVFAYRPGQYAMIAYWNKDGGLEDKHAFSIASSPTQKESIRFGIRVQGTFTKGLLQLEEGDELLVAGPYGDFVYDEKKYFDLVLIAGGIGITPFLSTIYYVAQRRLPNKLALLYSSKTKAGTAFIEEINSLKKLCPNLSVHYSFSEETNLRAQPNISAGRLDAAIIKKFIGHTYGKTFFICGPAGFMGAMAANLRYLGVTKDQIQMEEFSLLPDHNFWPSFKNLSYAVAFSAALFILSFSLISKSAATASSGKINISNLSGQTNQAAPGQAVISNPGQARTSAKTGVKNLISPTAKKKTPTNVSSASSITPDIARPTTVVDPAPTAAIPAPVAAQPTPIVTMPTPIVTAPTPNLPYNFPLPTTRVS